MLRKKKQNAGVLSPQQHQMIFEAVKLHQEGKIDLAEIRYRKLLVTIPHNITLLNNLGAIALTKGDSNESLNLFNQSLNLDKRQPFIHNSKGNILRQLNRNDDALDSYQKAIRFKPDYVECLCNIANLLKELGKNQEALEAYNQAISINPHYIIAYYGRGSVLMDLGKEDEAKSDYQKLINAQINANFSYANLLFAKRDICDWNNHAQFLDALLKAIENDKKVAPPFPIISFSDNPQLIQKAVTCFAKHTYPAQQTYTYHGKKHDKIRIAYYSSDFHNHATSYLIASLFEKHNRDQFDVIAVSFGDKKDDAMRQRITQSVDQFIDVRDKTDEEIIDLSRKLELDIAIDLKGFTKGMRLNIFAARIAPIQINYLGYPGTMAVDYMDYIIADHTLIPKENQHYYSEKILYLPDSYQPNDPKREIADTIYSKAEFGLPEDGFVFCSFNQSYKITPTLFDSWMKILHATDHSVLWILEEKNTTIANLKKEAKKHGINPDRLIFTKRMPLKDHLARHKLADLFLDTTPYNAHTTASDALWVGVPIITLMGNSFASRVCGSLLKAVGLEELITHNAADYEAKAIALAKNPEDINRLKSHLTTHRSQLKLFDIDRYTKNLEMAFQRAYEKYHTKKTSN